MKANSNFDDFVHANYAKLMESKNDMRNITGDDLIHVSDTAAKTHLSCDALSTALDERSNSLSHPFSRLWTGSLLHIMPYYEWVITVEGQMAVGHFADLSARH